MGLFEKVPGKWASGDMCKVFSIWPFRLHKSPMSGPWTKIPGPVFDVVDEDTSLPSREQTAVVPDWRERQRSWRVTASSHVFRSSDDFSSNLGPINACIHLFIDQSSHYDIVSSDHVQSMRLFHAWFRVVRRSNDAFHRVLHDHVRYLIARYKCACECATVYGDDQDFL